MFLKTWLKNQIFYLSKFFFNKLPKYIFNIYYFIKNLSFLDLLHFF